MQGDQNDPVRAAAAAEALSALLVLLAPSGDSPHDAPPPPGDLLTEPRLAGAAYACFSVMLHLLLSSLGCRDHPQSVADGLAYGAQVSDRSVLIEAKDVWGIRLTPGWQAPYCSPCDANNKPNYQADMVYH